MSSSPLWVLAAIQIGRFAPSAVRSALPCSRIESEIKISNLIDPVTVSLLLSTPKRLKRAASDSVWQSILVRQDAAN